MIDKRVADRLLLAAENARERVATLTATLVQMPSVSGEEGLISSYLEEWALGSGLTVDVWTPDVGELRRHRAYVPVDYGYDGRRNVVATLKGLRSGKGRHLILFGHVDTVPVDVNTEWRHGPFSGDIADGKVYGRGATDMKAGCAVAIVAVEILRDLGVSLNGDLSVHLILDEEAGGNGTLAAILRNHYSDGAACIMLEPTGSSVIRISGRGAQYFRLRVPGQEGATEQHRDLVSALDPAITLYRAVQRYAQMREAQAAHPLYDAAGASSNCRTKVPLAIGRFHAGAWPSTVPGEAVLEGTIECLPGEDIHAVVGDLERYLRQVAADDVWLRDHEFRFETFGLWFESAALASGHEFVRAMVHAGRVAVGVEPDVGPGGGSDLRLPILYADCPTILWGPGGSIAHSVDEWVDIEEAVKMLKEILVGAVEWCGTPEWRN